MKILIDFDKKKLTLESKVTLGEFFEKISILLPDWKEYSLEVITKIEWKYNFNEVLHIRKPYMPKYDNKTTTPNWPIITCDNKPYSLISCIDTDTLKY